jgi:glutathione S-transferase
MILIGRYLSPFVRRVGVTLSWLEVPFEHLSLSPGTDGAKVRPYNPMNKVPAVVLDSGEVLIDSTLILDSLLESMPAQTLLPAKGIERRDVLQRSGIMTSALDKAVAALYEKTKRPAEKIHQPFLDTLIEQARAGVDQVEAMVADGQFGSVEQATLADITAAVGYSFIRATLPEVISSESHPALAGLAADFEATAAFKACRLKA